MRVLFAPSFLRAVKKLDPSGKRSIRNAVSKIMDLYDSGRKTGGLGIKHLRKDLWEARSGIRTRIVYSLSKDRLTFILSGSHNDIRKFLKR